MTKWGKRWMTTKVITSWVFLFCILYSLEQPQSELNPWNHYFLGGISFQFHCLVSILLQHLPLNITWQIFITKCSPYALNDTVNGQWQWQLITLWCQQRFLGIWAAVLLSILPCSSSGGKKEQPRWEFCASVAIERWGNKLLNLSNHTVPQEFLK